MRNYVSISLLLLSLIFLLRELFRIPQRYFTAEFLFVSMIIIFSLLSILGMIIDKDIFLTITYSLILLDVIYIIIHSTVPVILILLSITGMILSFSKKKKKKRRERGLVEEIKNTHSFTASKLGKRYHTPSCDWAKKIALERRIHFKDEKDAKKAGFRPCSCIKKV